MHSRLYWIVWMLESVVTAEFDMANTKLPEPKDQVKLPQFVPHKYSQSSSFTAPTQSEEEPGYHYHFLSQAAHRIMLSRIHNTLYHSSKLVLSKHFMSLLRRSRYQRNISRRSS